MSLCKHGAVMGVFSLFLSLSLRPLRDLFLPLVTIIPLAVDIAQYRANIRTPSPLGSRNENPSIDRYKVEERFLSYLILSFIYDDRFVRNFLFRIFRASFTFNFSRSILYICMCVCVYCRDRDATILFPSVLNSTQLSATGFMATGNPGTRLDDSRSS